MKKKIISLALCLIMLLTTVLTGCTTSGDDGDSTDKVIDQASDSTMTLSMFIVCEKEVSDETAKLVSTAFNNITKSKFKTQVSLHFLTYDKYYSTIETMIAENDAHTALGEVAEKAFKKAKKDAKAEGVATDKAWEDSWYAEHPDYIEFRETEELTGDDTTAEETVMVTIEGAGDYSIPQLKYPDEKSYQLDIIWIDSYDRYCEYIEKEWLNRLDDELSSASKKLKEYISPSLLSWVKWSSDGTYAIPNNSCIGEYTYLLLNKKYIEKYNYDSSVSKITSIFSSEFKNYLADIANYESNVVPVSGDIPITNTLYWSYVQDTTSSGHVDTTKFNLLGSVYDKTKTYSPSDNSSNAAITAINLFDDFDGNSYLSQLRAIQSFKDAGYIVSEADAAGKEFGAKVVKGGAELADEYADDYYTVVLENPRISEDDLFSSMFAVTTFTRSLSRSMEIITYLNTNSELRNILQYGVEGVHYKVKENGVVERLNNDYMMDIAKTGNQFIAYPEENMSPDVWTYAKKQNIDALSGLLNCFRLTADQLVDNGAEDQVLVNTAALDKIKEASERVEKELAEIKNSDELERLIIRVNTRDYASNYVNDQKNANFGTAIYGYFYGTWAIEKKLIAPATDE